MATEKQIAANRRNARQSTGPKTAKGKARSSENALQHGVLSEKAISHYEEHEKFNALLAQLVAEFAPETALESTLVERIAILLWREKRLAAAEAEQITGQNKLADSDEESRYFLIQRTLPLPQQVLIGRYQGLLGRQIREALRDLRDEQERRLKVVEGRENRSPM